MNAVETSQDTDRDQSVIGSLDSPEAFGSREEAENKLKAAWKQLTLARNERDNSNDEVKIKELEQEISKLKNDIAVFNEQLVKFGYAPANE